MNQVSQHAGITTVAAFFVAAAVSLTPMTAFAQSSPFFTPGNLVVTVEGCGVYSGTCTGIPNGTGTGTENSSSGGYGDNQGAPLTLFQFTPTGTSSVMYVNSLVLPQTASGANFALSGEYGSSSEATIQLSGAGQYLTLMGYGVNDAAFNANPENYGTLLNPKGSANYGALAQTGSLTLSNQTLGSPYPDGYTPVPRVLALIDANGNVNTSSAFFNIFDFNNPRSAYTLNGSNAYVSGQGSGTDTTGGVFYSSTLGAINNAPVAITGLDSCASSGCTTPTIAQDTRTVQIYNNTLYISVDSTEGHSNNRSFIGTLGDPPATSMYVPATPPTGDLNGPMELKGFGNTGGTGKVTLTTNGNNINQAITGGVSPVTAINLSPENYFFASASVLYVADSGDPKNDSNGDNNCNESDNIGNGGLQKWVNSMSNGTGTWSLVYTLYQGLNLVNNCNSDGTTGLLGLTGVVSGTSVYLYATPFTLGDLDPSYLYGITDTLTNTTPPDSSEAFTLLATAPSDSNFKGVSFVPTIPAGGVEITTVPPGLTVTASGDSGCAPGTYSAPITLAWTPNDSTCVLSVSTPQVQSPQQSLQTGATGIQYNFTQWQDGTTSTSDAVAAPSTTAIYTATFETEVTGAVSVTTTGFVHSRATGLYTGTVTITNTSSAAIAFPLQSVLTDLTSGVTLTNATGAVSDGPYQGAPYYTVTGTSPLAPGSSVSYPIQFTYSGSAPITFVAKTISGTL